MTLLRTEGEQEKWTGITTTVKMLIEEDKIYPCSAVSHLYRVWLLKFMIKISVLISENLKMGIQCLNNKKYTFLKLTAYKKVHFYIYSN